MTAKVPRMTALILKVTALVNIVYTVHLGIKGIAFIGTRGLHVPLIHSALGGGVGGN